MMLWIHWWIPWDQEEIIRERVAKRAKHTGRSIPEAKLMASIAAVERWGLTYPAKMVEIIGWNYPAPRNASHHQDFHF